MRKAVPSKTAELVAFQRATDQRVPPARRIVDDPFAAAFVGPAMRATLAAIVRARRIGDLVDRAPTGLTNYVKARHRYIDDRLSAALARKRGAVRQVVVLGAGYDMRAHRMVRAIAGRPVFEVDHPATARRKAAILESLAREGTIAREAMARAVTVDFQRESFAEKLLASGFQRGERTFFIWEGVSMYLRRDAVQRTLSALAELGGRGSEVVFDLWHLLDESNLRAAFHRVSASLLHVFGEPVLFGIHPEDVGPFLDRLGIRVVEIADSDRLRALYVKDRGPVYPACYVVHART